MINKRKILEEGSLKEHVETSLITIALIGECFKDIEEAKEATTITYIDLRAYLKLFAKQIKEEHEEGLNN